MLNKYRATFPCRQEEERRRREEEMLRQREVEEQMRRQREENYRMGGFMGDVSSTLNLSQVHTQTLLHVF